MASPFPSLPFRSASESSDSLPLPENSKTTQNPGPTRGLCPINEQENRRPSNPYADPQVESSNDMTKVPRFSKPVVTVRLHRPPLHAPTIETQEETKSKLSHSLFRMPHPAFWKWPQGDAHPLKLVYHTLVFQAFIGFVVVVLVIHALRNPGWWTQRETAIGLAITAGTVTTFVVLPIQVAIGYVTPADTTCVRRIRTSVGTLLALLLMGLYGAAGANMVKSPGKDFRKAFDKPPYGVWWSATTLIFAQFILSGCCAYKVVKYFFKPYAGQVQFEHTSDSELDNYVTVNGTSQARAIPIQASSSGESTVSENQVGSAQFCTSSSQAFLQATDQPGRSKNVTDDAEVAGPSGQNHLSTRAKGKQRETRSDGIDELNTGLAGMDHGGSTWSPIK